VKARVVSVRPTIAAVIAVEVIALATLVVFPPGRATWWPAAGVAVAAILALLVTVHRRSAVGWSVAAVRWMRRRRRGPVPVPPAVDIPHGSALYGVRLVDAEAITMVNVSGQAYSPTVLTGSATALTPNLLPLDALSALLDQPGGIRLAGIDIVSSGVRVRRGIGYASLYSTLLADRPAAGQRSTQLVVRLDIARSSAGLGYRASVGVAAAAATERIVNALLQRGVRASALTAKDLDAALAELGAGLVTVKKSSEVVAGEADSMPRHTLHPTPTEGWKAVRAYPGYLSSYYFSPDDVSTNALNQMWALHSDAVVQTVSLTKNRGKTNGHPQVSALVRLTDPQPPTNPPTLYLNPLPGDAAPAAVRGAPARREFDRIPTRPLQPAGLDIPVGSSGVLVGTTLRGDLLLLALTDPGQSTRISMRASMAYTRQLLIRAAAVGERIAVYTDDPSRWTTLEQPLIAVVDRHHPPEFVPSIIVSDRATGPPPAGMASTVISIDDAEPAAAPDISFAQTSASMVRITTAAFTTDVHIATFKAEQPFLGQTADQIAL
jgi:type VII secretion protein EccE